MSRNIGLLFLGTALALAGCAPQADPDQVRPSVFRVAAVTTDDNGKITGGSLGSAFVVAPGYLVTNNHVVVAGNRFALYGNGLKDPVSARVVVRSGTLDLAVIATDTDLKRKPLALDVTPPKVGRLVYAVGYPGVDDQLMGAQKEFELAPVKNGNISASGKGSWGAGYEFDMIQHTAIIDHGNSGGPLLDSCNRVIGVNTAGAATQINLKVENSTLKADAEVHSVFQASGAAVLAKYLKEQNIPVQTVGGRCGDVPTGPTLAGGAAMLVAAGGYVYYRRRKGGAPVRLVGLLDQARTRLMTLKLPGAAASRLPPRGLRLLGAGAGGALSFDLPPRLFANALGAATVGRNPELVDVVIQSSHPGDKVANEAVSRSHARFLWKTDGFYVEDYGRNGEGSANKTFLNGEELPPASPRRVRAGDRIRFGQHEFQIFDL